MPSTPMGGKMSNKYSYVKGTLKRRRIRINKEYKEGKPCIRCGGLFPPVCLDFHHTDPDNKLFGIASGLYRHGWDKIVTEIVKCVLLCANCHRIVEYNAGRTNGKSPVS